jgi:Helix-turn-helix domain
LFEIGNSLREARLRQKLDLARAEADTKIRAKYLEALEEEDFDQLPGETYVKGFLRTYADYLGLDAQLYVDEFNSRFTTSDEPIVAHRPSRARQRRRESSFVLLALAGIAAVTILVIVAWKFSTGGAESGDASRRAASPHAVARQAGAATVVFNAIRGNSLLVIKAESPTGRLLYQGTLERGQKEQFARRKLWVQYGAGRHLEIEVDGKRVKGLPRGAASLVITARGARVLPRS